MPDVIHRFKTTRARGHANIKGTRARGYEGTPTSKARGHAENLGTWAQGHAKIDGTRARQKFGHVGTRARGHANIEGKRARRKFGHEGTRRLKGTQGTHGTRFNRLRSDVMKDFLILPAQRTFEPGLRRAVKLSYTCI